MIELEIYEVKQVPDQKSPKWAVYRPNGEIVNGCVVDIKKVADDYLSRLVSMGYCKRKD